MCGYLKGTTPDYWEDALTVPRLAAIRAAYLQDPPPEFFLAAFFRARFGWEPPEQTGSHRRDVFESEMPDPLPLYE